MSRSKKNPEIALFYNAVSGIYYKKLFFQCASSQLSPTPQSAIRGTLS